MVGENMGMRRQLLGRRGQWLIFSAKFSPHFAYQLQTMLKCIRKQSLITIYIVPCGSRVMCIFTN